MRHLKILGLLAVAAVASMAFAAPASATTITSPTGTAATPTVHGVSEEGAVAGTKHVSLHNSNANIECDSTFEGKVESHGSGITGTIRLSTVKWEPCSYGWTFTVVTLGEFTIHWTSGYNARVTWDGATMTATLNLGIFGHVTCRYATNNTDVGALTGGNPATLHIEAAIPFHSGGGLCGSGVSNWTGKYVMTGALYIDQ